MFFCDRCKATDFEKCCREGWWDYCQTCEAEPGRRCRDLRYARRTGTFHRNKPHRGRARIQAAITEGEK